MNAHAPVVAAETEAEDTTALVVVEPETALAVLTDPERFDDFLARVKAFTDALVPDTSTAKCATGSRFEVDHIVRWSWGGPHIFANWQLLCIPCHAEKTGAEAPQHAKAIRNARKAAGTARIKTPIPPRPFGASRPFPKDNRRPLRSRGFPSPKDPK